MWSWASGWAGDPEAYRGMPGQWAGEASNAGTRAEGRGIIEGPWDRKKVWQIEPQAPRGSTAANRNTRVRLRSSWSQSSALEHGIRRMHLPRVHYTQAPYLGRGGRELALALLLSVTSLCLGSPVVPSRAQAEVLETSTGWLERGCPGRPGRRVGLEVGQPQETKAVCPGVGANGFRSLVCRSGRESGGREGL